MSAVKAAFGLGILILGVALFAPQLIDTTNQDASDTLQLSDNESTDLTDVLRVTAENVSEAGDNATIHFENTRTLDSDSTFVNASQNGNVTLNGDRMNVSLTAVDSDGAVISVSYPPMFGWDSGPRTFFENMETVLVAFAVAIVIGAVAVVMKS